MVDGTAALVTAGGRGSRIAQMRSEKPLIEVLGRKLIDRAVDNIGATSEVSKLYISTSPHSPLTERYLNARGIEYVHTPGNGYVEDLHDIMSVIEEDHVLIVPVDMPLLRPSSLDDLISSYHRLAQPSLTVILSPNTIRSLGLEVTHTEVMEGRDVTFCGVSVLERREMLKDDYIAGGYYFTDNVDFAVNINTPNDLAIAEGILRQRGE
jgi:adenosylcobinamide-phosphate guanylyltransferase